MDLGTIQDALADFATFAKNIGTALTGWQDVVTNVLSFIGSDASSVSADATGDNVDGLSTALSSGSSAAEAE